MPEPSQRGSAKGPSCDCFSGSVIDEHRHAEWCSRRLWTERNDARAEVEEQRGELRNLSALMYDLADVLNDQLRGDFAGRGWLARAVIDALDRDRERTDVDEWDESDTRCFAYNAAYAILEGRDPREA